MSGTSLDGLDIALCKISGSGYQTRVHLECFESFPFDAGFVEQLKTVFAREQVALQELTVLHVLIAQEHARLVNKFLSKNKLRPHEVDILASHGQTVFHAPRRLHGLENMPNATLQLGEPDHLARETGIITLSDFRQKHLAAGGEGAPLALYGDAFLFSKKDTDRILLNIGGIANFSFLPGDQSQPVHALDTGPGNTLMDAFAQKEFGQRWDVDGLIAAKGLVDEWLLAEFLSDPYFAQKGEKTTGQEYFNWKWVENKVAGYPKGKPNPYNLMRTLCELTAKSISILLNQLPVSSTKCELFASGGGVHNSILMERITAFTSGKMRLEHTDQLGIPADAKEAVLFAVLANETLSGTTETLIPGLLQVSMGKISLPN
jgi:anhydro-N-acetylmuramic acid kinase